MRLRAAVCAAAFLALAACSTRVLPPVEEPASRTMPEKADPTRRADAHLQLAVAYLGNSQAQAALDEVNQVIKDAPNSAGAYNVLGLVRAALGDNLLAEQAFRRSLQLAPDNAGTLHNYGWYLCQRRRFDEAEAQFRLALVQPQYREVGRTRLAQGVCEANAGHWAEAEKTLMHAFELEPTNPVVAFNLADVLYKRGENQRALFYIQRVNAVAAQVNAQSLWLAARIQRRLGNDAAVSELGRQLSDRYPQSPQTASFDQGRFNE
ncbi:MAG: type IV pilus biogenesis/stability protein PilW [Burkholderiales bacterium]|nr:type IV pilus biogenesis/stability protein PilW [Burkholderiales bacterium]MDE2456834.1 type IV pilus biogenesis/stability protein PilW [Burkholderiales bacterium]